MSLSSESKRRSWTVKDLNLPKERNKRRSWTVKDLKPLPEGCKRHEQEAELKKPSRWLEELWQNLPVTQNIVHLSLINAFRGWSNDHIHRILVFICALGQVEKLELQNNRLTFSHLSGLPFANLQRLRHLDLSANMIEAWPTNLLLFNFALEFVDFSKNRLTSVPAVFLHLKSLKTIGRGNNPMSHNFDFLLTPKSKRVRFIHVGCFDPTLHSLQVQCCSQLLRSPGLQEKLPNGIFGDVVSSLLTAKFCNFCCGPLASKFHFSVLLFPENLWDNTYFPMLTKTCSKYCASEIFDKWDWTVAGGKFSIPLPLQETVRRKHRRCASCCSVM